MTLSTMQPVSPTVSPPPRIRVALIEDDPVQRHEIGRLVSSASAMELVGTWPSAELAAGPVPTLNPSVVLVDIGLPGQSGIALVAALKPQLAAAQFMMLTVCDDTERIFSALAAGASGYLLKKDAPTELLEAVMDLQAGGSPMSSAIARKVVMHFQQPARGLVRSAPQPSPLTPREQEILTLLDQGLLYKEIAWQLAIGLGTVRTHIRRIYEKLQARNRTEAVRLGVQYGGMRSADH